MTTTGGKTGNYYYGASSRRALAQASRRRSGAIARPSPALWRGYYDPKVSVWLSVDPKANKNLSHSPYVFLSDNPIMRVDPDGEDDYYIQPSGSITVKITNDKTDSFFYVAQNGTTHNIATVTPNSNGLSQPSNISYSDFGNGVFVNISIKNRTRKKGTGYLSSTALASMIGASAGAQGEEIFITRASNPDGSSPGDSYSHKNGNVFDMRYVTKDGSRSPLNYSSQAEHDPFDYGQISMGRSEKLNNSLSRFGWKDIGTSKVDANIPFTGSYQIPGTRHLGDHYDHQHVQGYRPSVNHRDTRTIDLPAKSIENIDIR